MSAHVSPVKITMDDGFAIAWELDKPSGDNPRFYSSQVEEQLAKIAKATRIQLEARYGTQDTGGKTALTAAIAEARSASVIVDYELQNTTTGDYAVGYPEVDRALKALSALVDQLAKAKVA